MNDLIEIKSVKDLEKIKPILRGIISELCWSTHFSYPNVLCLEAGEKIPRNNDKLKSKYRGEWSIIAQASFWVILYKDTYVVNADEDRGISDEKIKVLENKKITDVNVEYPSLSLVVVFEDDYKLIITPPDPAMYGDEYDDVSDWEALIPGNMMIEMMPKNKYYYRRSDVFYGK